MNPSLPDRWRTLYSLCQRREEQGLNHWQSLFLPPSLVIFAPIPFIHIHDYSRENSFMQNFQYHQIGNLDTRNISMYVSNPFTMDRMWGKVNICADYTWYEFKVFLLLDWLYNEFPFFFFCLFILSTISSSSSFFFVQFIFPFSSVCYP